jgi:hypothetical protein
MSRDVHSCTHWLRPRDSPPSLRIWARITRALLVSKDRRHLFVTLPTSESSTTQRMEYYIRTHARLLFGSHKPLQSYHKVRTYKEYHSVSPRRNWDSPPTPTRRLVCPLPPVSGGRGTLAGEEGVGRVPIPTSGIHCGTLYMYVLCESYRQVRTGDTVVKSREMTGRSQHCCCVGGEEKG